jgi:Skp family chaperone for outer membrane proteins
MKVVGTAILCVVVAAALAPARRAQKMNLPLTRFAYVDGQALAADGVKLDKDGKALADLRAFGEGLKVNIIDADKLSGIVYIADERLNLTDAFLAARKARRSKSAPLEVPAVNVPSTTVAFVNTEAFGTPQTGITKLVNAFKSLEAEFKPRKDEIARLREQLEAGSGDRKRLEGEIKRKQAAGQAELDKRVKELTGPVYEDIGKSLTPFCKKHGISLLFDVSKIKRADKLPPLDTPFPPDMRDVTAAFISAYNRGALLDNILIP